MRHDREVLGPEIVDSPEWEQRNSRFEKLIIPAEDENGRTVLRAYPFSAHETNAFFLNPGAGSTFLDLSPLSGTDTDADSRSFALIDYDRDGDHDLAMANANSPSFQLYRTRVPTPGNFVAIRLTGGARPGSTSSPPLSNRDAIGTQVTVRTPSGLTLTRTLNAGEGYGAQNSKTILVGLGADTRTSSIHVRWPSGRTFTLSAPLRHTNALELEEFEDTTAFSIVPYLSP